jgi:hypothetical protein
MDARTASLPDYFGMYKNIAVTRGTSGVLTMRFHTGDGEHTFDGTTHHDFPRCWTTSPFDRDNQVLVITGTGDSAVAPHVAR